MIRKIVFLFIAITSFLSAKSVGIVVDSRWMGEYSFALRLEQACKNLGWKSSILSYEKFSSSSQRFSFVITLTPDLGSRPQISLSPNYLVLFDPIHHYYDEPFKVKNIYSNFSAYLTTFAEQSYLNIQQNRVYPNPWYPTSHYRPYRKVSPKGLFYFIGAWGNRLSNPNYKILQKRLSEENYTHFFGNPDNGSQYGEAYKGSLPQEVNSISDTIHEIGICLVLHSNVHNANAIPSGRIFEAAAASAIIICDKNPFVEKTFKDSVLYIDQKKSGEDMFSQIDAHMQWIFSNLDKAQQMAKRSHQIFAENFLLEKQLLKLNKWNYLYFSNFDKKKH